LAMRRTQELRFFVTPTPPVLTPPLEIPYLVHLTTIFQFLSGPTAILPVSFFDTFFPKSTGIVTFYTPFREPKVPVFHDSFREANEFDPSPPTEFPPLLTVSFGFYSLGLTLGSFFSKQVAFLTIAKLLSPPGLYLKCKKFSSAFSFGSPFPSPREKVLPITAKTDTSPA